MPFDDDDVSPSLKSQKTGLKKAGSQKSVFDNMPKKPSNEDFAEKVKDASERNSGYKQQAVELATMFVKAMSDKTLNQNKNILSNDAEREILQRMVQLAIDINNDPNEKEGMGSLSWITLLLKTCFAQRDKLNQLEYAMYELEKNVSATVKKQIVAHFAELDKTKISE